MLHKHFALMSLTALVVGSVSFVTHASAHFVWIESPATVSLGQPVVANAYFGEYNGFLREEAGGRLDDRAGLTAAMIGPNGTKLLLDLEQKINSFRMAAQSDTPGIYHLIATDLDTPVKDGTPYESIGVLYKPMFYARTQFLAFEPGRVSEQVKTMTDTLLLDIIPITSHLDPLKGTISPKVGDEVVLQVVFRGQPLAKAKPFAYAPNGWIKELPTNDSGITRFTPLWPGIYVIDCVNLEKTPGEFQGKRYEAIRHRATFTILVANDEEGRVTAHALEE